MSINLLRELWVEFSCKSGFTGCHLVVQQHATVYWRHQVWCPAPQEDSFSICTTALFSVTVQANTTLDGGGWGRCPRV